MDLSKYARRGGKLLYITFNQDYTAFACGTDTGFFVCNADPLKERFRREFEGENAGIGIVEMLFKCNILALVGGGEKPKYPPNKVMIWDDYQGKAIAELEFRSPVRSVRLRRDRIVVGLERKVYVYNFADLQLLAQLETYTNNRGLCALAPSINNTVLAVPGLHPGSVRVELYSTGTSQTIAAHNTALAALAITSEGHLLATASEKGTLIRLWDCESGEMVKELRRGADKAEIHSIAFNSTATALCVSSDKGTVHIYSLPPNLATSHGGGGAAAAAAAAEKKKNKQSTFSFMKDVLPSYFSSEWSMVSFNVPNRSICAFGPVPGSVIVVSGDGTYQKEVYESGDSKRLVYTSFVQTQL